MASYSYLENKNQFLSRVFKWLTEFFISNNEWLSTIRPFYYSSIWLCCLIARCVGDFSPSETENDHPIFLLIGIFNLPDGIFNFEFESGSSFFVKFIVFFSFIFIILRIKWSRFNWQEIWEAKKCQLCFRNLWFQLFSAEYPTLEIHSILSQ